jgi:hypothetical protein
MITIENNDSPPQQQQQIYPQDTFLAPLLNATAKIINRTLIQITKSEFCTLFSRFFGTPCNLDHPNPVVLSILMCTHSGSLCSYIESRVSRHSPASPRYHSLTALAESPVSACRPSGLIDIEHIHPSFSGKVLMQRPENNSQYFKPSNPPVRA